ncbi:hypothetical protein ACAG39_01395 [Caldicellulosiruptoraceae bacterium PP1]
MIAINCIYSKPLNKFFKQYFVDYLRKKGKKISEIYFLKDDDFEKIEKYNEYDYIVYYTKEPVYKLYRFTKVIILLTDITNTFFDNIDLNDNAVIFQYNGELFGNYFNNLIIDVGFLSTNTINVSSIEYSINNEILFTLSVQREFSDIYNNTIPIQEVIDHYITNVPKKYIDYIPLITVLKIYLNIFNSKTTNL